MFTKFYNVFHKKEKIKNHSQRVLFVLKERHSYGGEIVVAGQSSGLYNSANQVSTVLRDNGIKSSIVEVVDGNGIDREVHAYKPTVVILEALWVTPSKVAELSRLYPKVRWIVRVHSNTPFIANEGIAIGWLKEYADIGNNVFISANADKFFNDLKIIIDDIHHSKILYLPNIYKVTHSRMPKPIVDQDCILNISCFGAIRPLKNQLIQAVAALEFANRRNKILHFHINDTRLEQGGNSVLKNLEALFDGTVHKLVSHTWMSREDFLQLISTMDICMQVSFSETFNICSADAINEGKPVVVSPEINWINHQYQASPTDTMDIVSKLEYAYTHRKNQEVNWFNLANYNVKSTAAWINVLTRTHHHH